MLDYSERKDAEHCRSSVEDLLLQHELRREEAERLRGALLGEARMGKPSVEDVESLAAKLELYFDERVPVPSYHRAQVWEQQPVISVRANDVLCRVGPRALGMVKGDDWQLFIDDWMSGEPGLIPTEVRLFAEPVTTSDCSVTLPTTEDQAIELAARILILKIVNTVVPQLLEQRLAAASRVTSSDN